MLDARGDLPILLAAPLLAAPLLAALLLVVCGCDSSDVGDTVVDVPDAAREAERAGEPDGVSAADASPPDAAQPDGSPPDAAPVDPTAGSGTCEGTTFDGQHGIALKEDYGVLLQAIDEGSPTRALIIELHDDRGEPVGVGGHDLAGNTVDDCRVCVLACDVVDGACSTIYFADEGVVNITARGAETGDPVALELNRVRFKEATFNAATRELTNVPGGDSWCGDGYGFDLQLAPKPAMVGDLVEDFSLQNCATGEFTSMHAVAADVKAAWFIATAGWCSACHAYLPQILEATAQIPESLLSIVIVLGEDGDYEQPTLTYCRAYARRYTTAAPTRFYIDHDGTSSFATTFSRMWPYVGGRGEFGLPWNAVLDGGTYRYEYADGAGAPRTALVDIVNRLLND